MGKVPPSSSQTSDVRAGGKRQAKVMARILRLMTTQLLILLQPAVNPKA
jgi:hypothetical protein